MHMVPGWLDFTLPTVSQIYGELHAQMHTWNASRYLQTDCSVAVLHVNFTAVCWLL